jgi:hypothetical protein
MPAFTIIGAAVASAIGLTGLAATVVGGIIATGAAYITSRVINGNPNKGANSAQSQGGRIQVPPATNNKIPVLYGSAFVNGIITDAHITNKNQRMIYSLVLSEKVNACSVADYTLGDIYWNDLKLVFETSAPHKVLKGTKIVDGIESPDDNFKSKDGKNLVEIRIYAGGAEASNQIFPTTDKIAAYDYVNSNDSTDAFWTQANNKMTGLVFAIVKINYDGDKGFTGLPNVTFNLKNTLTNPALVMLDYLKSDRYGANIPESQINLPEGEKWGLYCNELITYTALNQQPATQKRFEINGILDTSRPVKENMDIILQNGGAWLSYDVADGKWRPIPKKALTETELGQCLVFDDSNIISGINLSSTRLDDLYNKFEVEFYDKLNREQRAYARRDLRVSAPTLMNPNERDNQLRMSLDLTNNSVQAELIGNIELRQSRDDLVIQFSSSHYGVQAQAGDVIKVTSDIYQWNPKLFRITRVKEQETSDGNLIADITALEYNPDVYTVEDLSEFTTSANTGIKPVGSSDNLKPPTDTKITNPQPDSAVPNFTLQVTIPTEGGAYDKIEVYYVEGWDEFSVTGTITKGTGEGIGNVPLGKGLMTITQTAYDAINSGDYVGQIINGVTQRDFQVDNQILPLGFNEVEGGIGRYQITPQAGAVIPDEGLAGTAYIFDSPIESSFKFLKSVAPDGNRSVFEAGEIVKITVSQLPPNTLPQYRWYLKTRLGNKGTFSAFSANTGFDIEQTSVAWQPNPVAAGSLADLSDVILTAPTNGQMLVYSGTYPYGKWVNGAGGESINIKTAILKLDFGKCVLPNNGFWLWKTMTQIDFGDFNSEQSPYQLDLGLTKTVENTVDSSTTLETFVWQIDAP